MKTLIVIIFSLTSSIHIASAQGLVDFSPSITIPNEKTTNQKELQYSQYSNHSTTIDVQMLKGYKSPAKAFWLSFLSTAIPTGIGITLIATNVGRGSDVEDLANLGGVILATGVILGPSVGHLYLGNTGRALGMTAARAVAPSAGFLVGLGLLAIDDSNDSDFANLHLFGAAILVGFSISAILAVWDIIDAPLAANRHNKKLLQNLNITPTVLRTASGNHAMGLGISGRF